MVLVHGSYFVLSYIIVNSVSFFPILVGLSQHHHSVELPAEAIATIQVQISEPKKSTREFRDCFCHHEISPRRKFRHAGSDNSTWVPFLVFQFLLTDPEADHVFQGFFHQTKWSMIHDVNTSLHWRLGDLQSKMKKWFLVQSRSWRFYHPRCQHRFSQSCCQSHAGFKFLRSLGALFWAVNCEL